MGKFKINSNLASDYRTSTGQQSDFYRRFKSQFATLLNPDPTNRLFLENVYVKNVGYHADLDNFQSTFEDSYRCLIGLTGVGKTTLIRNFFGLNPTDIHGSGFNSEIILDDNQIIAVINPEATALPESAQTYAGYLFGAVVERLKKKFNLEIDDEELFDFISQNKPSLIQGSTLTRKESHQETLDNMFKTNRRGLSLETIKFILVKDACTIKNVTIILDNIEALTSWDATKEYVSEALIDFECLKNNLFKYCVKLVMSCRPDTYYRLLSEDTFNGYPHRNELSIETVAPIDEIFRMRFNAVVERDGICAGDKEEWHRSYAILADLSKTLSVNNGSLITSLWNHNVREAVNHFERILANRQWFQRGLPVRPAFKIERSLFKPYATVIKKALIYGNGIRYVSHHDNPIINYLQNDSSKEYDLIPLYILAFFHTQIANDNDDHYFKYIDVSHLLHAAKTFFIQEDIRARFLDALSFYIEKGLLFVSPWDDGSKTKLALTPRIEALISLTTESSVLLEAFRDDLWLDDAEHIRQHSGALPKKQLYLEIKKIIWNYITAEKGCVELVKNSKQIQKYVIIFGTLSITRILCKGFGESVFGLYSKEPEAEKDWGDIKRELDNIEKILQGV